MIRIVPIGLREAGDYIAKHHRHHPPTRGHKFSIAVVDGRGIMHGVGVAGRPVSRHLQSAGHIEVLRVATDGTRNACSMLYGAMARIAVAMGYDRHQIITYTLASEPGTSLRASGWVQDRDVRGESWGRPSRPRVDVSPTADKRRWRAAPVPVGVVA